MIATLAGSEPDGVSAMQRAVIVIVGLFLIVLGLTAPKASSFAEQASANAPLTFANYVILHAGDLSPAAEQWADYRVGCGFTVRLVNWSAFAKSEDPILAARKAVHEAYREPSRNNRVNFDVAGKPRHWEPGIDAWAHSITPDPRQPATVGYLLILGDAPDGGTRLSAPPKEFKFDPNRVPLHIHASLKDASPRAPRPAAGDYIWALPPDVGPDDADAQERSGSAGWPREIAVGRVPARTGSQATAVLEKIKRHEATQAHGEWQQRLSFVAGEGRFGPVVDQMLEQMFVGFADTVIPPEYRISMTYANPNSAWASDPRQLTDRVVEGIRDGSLLTAYVGHGQVTRLDSMRIAGADGKEVRFPIGDRDSIVSQLQEPSDRLAMMLIIACQTGCFDQPKDESLGEALLFAPGGPVTILAGSRDTHPYANALVQKEFVCAVTGQLDPAGMLPSQYPDCAGTAWLATQRYLRSGLAGGPEPDQYFGEVEAFAGLMLQPDQRTAIREAHLWLYNLIGDPATRIQRQFAWPEGLVKLEAEEVHAGGELVLEFANQVLRMERLGVPAMLVSPELTAQVEVWSSVLLEEPKPVDWKLLLSGNDEEQAAERKKLTENHAMAHRKGLGKPLVATGKALEATVVNDAYGKTMSINPKFRIVVPEDLGEGSYRLRVSVKFTCLGGPTIDGAWHPGYPDFKPVLVRNFWVDVVAKESE